MVKSRHQTARKPASKYANLQKKMQKQPFIPAKELRQEYGVFGHFYSVELASKEVVECRSVLEIAQLSALCHRL